MQKTETAARVGGKKVVVWGAVKSIGAFLLFVLYMIPFALVLINSLKRKVSIIKYPYS